MLLMNGTYLSFSHVCIPSSLFWFLRFFSSFPQPVLTLNCALKIFFPLPTVPPPSFLLFITGLALPALLCKPDSALRQRFFSFWSECVCVLTKHSSVCLWVIYHSRYFSLALIQLHSTQQTFKNASHSFLVFFTYY